MYPQQADVSFQGGVKQTGGEVYLRNDSIVSSGIAQESNAIMYITDNMALGSESFIITQSGNANLVIGRITSEKDKKSGWGSTATYRKYTVNIEQTGTGVITLAEGTSFLNDSTVNITQNGSGTINIGGGLDPTVVGATGRKADSYGNIEHHQATDRKKFTSTETTYSISQLGTNGCIKLLNGTHAYEESIKNDDKKGTNAKAAAAYNAKIAVSDINQKTGNKLELESGTSINATGTVRIGGNLTNAGSFTAQTFGLLQSAELSNTGIIHVGTGTAGTKVGGLYVTKGGTFGVIANSSNQTTSVFTVGASGCNVTEWTMTSDSTFGIGMTDAWVDSCYTGTMTQDTESVSFDFDVLVATGLTDKTGLKNQFGIIDMDEAHWSLSSTTEWVQDGNETAVEGTLIYTPWVKVSDAASGNKSYSDTTDKLLTGLDITGNVTLKGANTHSLGTRINDAVVTLGNASALGAGPVTTTGETSLSTADKVTATLTQAITNKGKLTLSGSYDVSGLDDVPLPDNFIDVYGVEGTTGFAQYNRFEVEMVKKGADDATLVLGDADVEYQPKARAAVGTLEGVLGTDGVATFVGGTDYSTYVIDNPNHQVSVSQIQDASNDQTTTVEMSDGELTADESIEVETTGGTLITEGDDTVVRGTIENTIVSAKGGTISGDITESKLTTETGSLVSGDVTKSEITVNGGEISGDIEESTITANGGTISGDITGGSLAMQKDALVSGSVTDTAITTKGGEISGTIGGASSLTAMAGMTTLSGSGNSYTGGTVVKDGATLVVTKNGGLGIGGVTVESGATLDMKTDGDAQIEGGLTVNDNGTITLNNGSLLVVDGSVTLNDGAIIILEGEYDLNSALVSSTTGALTMGDVTLVYNGTTVELEMQNGQVVLVSKFKQDKANAATLSNWGIATASRAVVNAVRGQRSNTGCIANGKGTAWVASLGSKHEINGSDIDISGAAVGADMQVGRNSRIGIALGYAEGEVQPAGFSQVDQEGTYLVVYGEHGLKKLSATSCLSMDWVAAYGTTDSEVGGLKWEQDSLQLNSRVNWNKKVNNRLCMSVFGGLEYFANNSATVDGVKTGSIQNLRGEIGVGARYVAWGTPAVTDGKSGLVLAQGCEKLVLNGEVRYMNDMVRSNPVIRMNGLSGMGENPGRQGIGIEAGATYRIGERWSASANYGFNTMEDSKEHRLNIGAAYTF